MKCCRRLLKTITVLLIILFNYFSFDANATKTTNDPLNEKITELIESTTPPPADAAINRTIKILTPSEQFSTLCVDPELSIAGNNNRLTGNKSIIAQCGTLRKFIQISVQASGSWWEASHSISPGSVILASDIQLRSGSLSNLPAGLVFDSDKIIGQTTTRTINKGQPLIESQLRKSWVVMVGQEVEILAIGEGFQIRTKGKALDSNAIGQSVRVLTHAGQVVTGVVTPSGLVNINFRE